QHSGSLLGRAGHNRLMAPAIARPTPAPHTTSSGLWAPTYTRVTITIATTAHGSTFHRPGRYGVISPAIAATRTAWPDTKLSPVAVTSPRRWTSPPIEVPGRCLLATTLTARSMSNLVSVAIS